VSKAVVWVLMAGSGLIEHATIHALNDQEAKLIRCL
jgi:hypothetical protein